MDNTETMQALHCQSKTVHEAIRDCAHRAAIHGRTWRPPSRLEMQMRELSEEVRRDAESRDEHLG
ncbi:MAG: hypothetical protein ACR2GA_03025 [Chloroflexota bacterium]